MRPLPVPANTAVDGNRPVTDRPALYVGGLGVGALAATALTTDAAIMVPPAAGGFVA